jgi:hypothetical protein
MMAEFGVLRLHVRCSKEVPLQQMKNGMKPCPERSDGYTRTLVRDVGRTLIGSECKYCGLVIVGSVPEITDDERRHRDTCSAPDTAGLDMREP